MYNDSCASNSTEMVTRGYHFAPAFYTCGEGLIYLRVWLGAKSSGRNPRFSSSDSDGGVSNAGASRIGSMVAEQVQNQESHDR